MDYDVIVVGSGAGGSAAAWRLAQLGLKVACIERGDWQRPENYPSTGLDWELRKRRDSSYNPAIRKSPADYCIDTTQSDIDIANFNGVGGATVLYSAHFPRFHPSDFCTQTLDGVGCDWPISYADLEPYFSANDRMMRVSGLSGDPAYPEIDGMLPPIPIGDYGAAIAKGFNALGWHWWPSYAAIASGKYTKSPCLNLGPCNTGCPQGAKSSTDQTYIPEAQKLGMTLKVNTVVTQVEVNENDQVKGIWIKQHSQNNPEFISAKVVVLACNAIGTARLLLASANKSHPAGLANSSGLVGKNLMLHPLGYVEGIFEKPMDMDKGPQGCCIYSHEFYETDASRNFKRGYTLHVLRGGGLSETASAGIDRREISWGSKLIQGVKKSHRRRASIAVICEDLPVENNYVSIDPKKLDKDGMPLAKVHYKMGENSKAMMAHGLTQGKRALKASGLKKIMAFGPVKDAGWHILGTARMGVDPKASVVNSGGESHDISGLFIADGSVFPSSGGVNPASTIQAVALRIADNIYERHFGILNNDRNIS